ncbi:MAG: hypothetical protein F6J86_28110, partial [Symploca sp. SIO1B1]|nr:hypothetical protein [Symploca sp. SIO1B1]
MSNLGTRLAQMPSDQRRATLVSLPSHLANAAQAERLQSLLTNFGFIEAKVSELDPQQLIEDYDLTQLPTVQISQDSQESLKLIQGAIKLSANVLNEDKTQLAGQLLGRLLYFKPPELQRMLKQIEQWRGLPWLRPLKPNLTPPEGHLRYIFTGHTESVSALALAPNGQQLVSASYDCTLKVWDLESGSESKTLSGHNNPVFAVAITPNGQQIVSA